MGCTCDEPAPASQPAPSASLSSAAAPASASAKPARTPRPTHPAPKAETFKVSTADGVRIQVSAWRGGEAASPAVVLVHRLGGTHEEWIPLIERVFPPKSPMNVYALDLRGHGQSKEAKDHPKAKDGKVTWQSFDNAAFEKMDGDLEALLARLGKDKGGPPAAWVLAGSDLGATLAVRQAAKLDAAVVGVALVSPGAALRGMDIYEPFGKVLNRPNLILAGLEDNVSAKSAKAMAAMSKSSTLVTFEAREHAAQFLGEKRWEMWDELADWVEARVRPQTPKASASASAAGSAPKPSASAAPVTSGR